MSVLSPALPRNEITRVGEREANSVCLGQSARPRISRVDDCGAAGSCREDKGEWVNGCVVDFIKKERECEKWVV